MVSQGDKNYGWLVLGFWQGMVVYRRVKLGMEMAPHSYTIGGLNTEHVLPWFNFSQGEMLISSAPS